MMPMTFAPTQMLMYRRHCRCYNSAAMHFLNLQCYLSMINIDISIHTTHEFTDHLTSYRSK